MHTPDNNTHPYPAEKGIQSPFPASVFDIHCHLTPPQPGRIVCLDPTDSIPPLYPGQYYSIGIHPWNAERATEADIQTLETLAANPQILAIGEIGLDTLRAKSTTDALTAQRALALRQALLAETVSKPVIWHIVRRWDDLLAMKRELRPTQPWIIHGFGGGETLARQLTRAGLILSLGSRARQDVRQNIPHLNESDALPHP